MDSLVFNLAPFMPSLLPNPFNNEIEKIAYTITTIFFFVTFCVSWMQDVQIVLQCWIEDGRRPAAYVMQIRCANHPKVLYSKDMVLNVWAKRCREASGECSEAERKWTV